MLLGFVFGENFTQKIANFSTLNWIIDGKDSACAILDDFSNFLGFKTSLPLSYWLGFLQKCLIALVKTILVEHYGFAFSIKMSPPPKFSWVDVCANLLNCIRPRVVPKGQKLHFSRIFLDLHCPPSAEQRMAVIYIQFKVDKFCFSKLCLVNLGLMLLHVLDV